MVAVAMLNTEKIAISQKQLTKSKIKTAIISKIKNRIYPAKYPK